MESEIQITATYDKDTYCQHRYHIDENQPIKGTLYIPKDADAIPERVIIELKEQVRS